MKRIWANILGFFSAYEASDEEMIAVKSALEANGNEVAELSSSLSFASSQAGTYLSHVSMMIAVTGVFMAVGKTTSATNNVLLVELIGYLVLALVAIRCQFRINWLATKKAMPVSETPRKLPLEKRHAYHDTRCSELVYRDKLLRFLMWAVYVLTAALIATLLFGSYEMATVASPSSTMAPDAAASASTTATSN